jgi:hypothetical protein
MPGSSKLSLSFIFPHTKAGIHFYSPHTRYMPHPPNSSRFVQTNNSWWGVEIMKLLILYFSPFLSYLISLGPKYSSPTPSACVPPSVWATKLPTHIIFVFLDSKLEDKIFCTEWWKAFPDFSLFLISPRIEFLYVRVVSKYLNFDLEAWPCT